MRRLNVLGVTEDSKFLAGGRLAFIKLMKALAVAGNNVVVLANAGATQGVVDPRPAHVLRLTSNQTRILGVFVFLVKLFFALPRRLMGCDIVVVNSGYTLHLVVFLSKIIGRKVVVFQHDANSLDYMQRLASTRSRRYTTVARWILMYTPLRAVDGVLCISDTTGTRLRSMGFNLPSYKVGNVVE